MSSEPSRLGPTDVELLQRAASGDLEAFGVLYTRYHHVVYRFGRAMTGCPTAAEDITQEVFLRLFDDLTRYEPGRASFTTYLYGIVRNLSRERLRRERRVLALEVLGVGGRDGWFDDPGGAIERAQQAAVIRRALLALPARYRELIVLCDVHGLSYADAGLVVHISTAAVRSRLHRGRRLLRQRLARLTRTAPGRTASPARCAI